MEQWDYLIVTASNDAQAQAYQSQLRLRRQLGLVQGVKQILVLPDPGARRIGSGGSTLYCLREVLQQELKKQNLNAPEPAQWQEVFSRLRILIVHAGGDSKRLPAYSPCGKIFVPVPGKNDSCLPLTLFDRQVPTYLALPSMPPGTGQIVITAGDVLLRFDPLSFQFAPEGVTGLGSYATPEQAQGHGVFCRGQANQVRCFLQKPSPADQQDNQAIDPYGKTVLDIGVMNFEARTARILLEMCGLQSDTHGELQFLGSMGEALTLYELDFYREICCALGTDVTPAHYLKTVKTCTSPWDEERLQRLFQTVNAIPFHVSVLPQCDFLHFGTTRQVISSGNTLVQYERLNTAPQGCLSLNNEIAGQGQVTGTSSWVEGCRIKAKLVLSGDNVLVGADIDTPLSLPAKICLDLTHGRNRNNEAVAFMRCYSSADQLNDSVDQGVTFCGIPVLQWLEQVKGHADQVWDTALAQPQRSLWNAKLFPALKQHSVYGDWLWMSDPSQATAEEIDGWHAADRYSSAEIALLTDQQAFHQRRASIRSDEIRAQARKVFAPQSAFSASDLGHLLANSENPGKLAGTILDQASWHHSHGRRSLDSLIYPRIMHTLGTALTDHPDKNRIVSSLVDAIQPATQDWLKAQGLTPGPDLSADQWIGRLRELAFASSGDVIVSGGMDRTTPPQSVLRSDEIVWGRAPARFDTGGGWTDTPPYALEHGGCVVNTAVNLNGQAPIQAYLRVIEQPIIRIGSIDLGRRIEISELHDLLNYREATSEYGLAKAALALSGFSPQTANWPQDITLEQMLRQFGGGIELTTLAAIPKGSGLGTSSIMGAVLMAVIQRSVGRTLTHNELFHAVLCLEQMLTTGGGWQDQIGGAVGGVKIVSAQPGLVPAPQIHYLPSDLLDPEINAGQTLLYYTGITRLAKNILEQVVGRYLDRNRHAMATLGKIHQVALKTSEAISRKDMARFGALVNTAWELNKELDPNSTNDEVEALLKRVGPYCFGAKLLGAGGGGFLLMVCKSPQDAQTLRADLEKDPSNERARFFDYNVNPTGLTVTVC
jgi:fucokinase